MKYVYTIAGIFMVLFGTHIYAYSEGYKAGSNKVAVELHETMQAQSAEIIQDQTERPLPGIQKAAVNEERAAEVNTKMGKRIDPKHISIIYD